MKVVKSGSGQRGWATETTCSGAGNGKGGCGAVLMVEQDDLFKTHHYDYGGGHDTYITFRCVECRVLTDIDVPGSIYSQIREQERRVSNDPL